MFICICSIPSLRTPPHTHTPPCWSRPPSHHTRAWAGSPSRTCSDRAQRTLGTIFRSSVGLFSLHNLKQWWNKGPPMIRLVIIIALLFIFGRTLLGQLRQIINMCVELQPKYRTEQQFETASSQHITTTESIVATRINFWKDTCPSMYGIACLHSFGERQGPLANWKPKSNCF